MYHGHFKCNAKRIGEGYPRILAWLRRMAALPGVRSTIDMEHIKKHYYVSHRQLNPTGIVPIYNGPSLD